MLSQRIEQVGQAMGGDASASEFGERFEGEDDAYWDDACFLQGYHDWLKWTAGVGRA